MWICVVMSRNIFSRLFFFFKQKTAYEMRINDWSSDVCSSDLLESFCARFAARRMTADERRCLAEVHDACRNLAEAGEVHAYYDANRRFHEVIYAGSHNTYLEETTRRMRNRLSPYRRFQLNHPGRIMKSWSEPRAVVDAILGGAAQAEAEAMAHHVTIQGDVFTDLISALPESYLHAMPA